MKKILVLIEDSRQISKTIDWALFHTGSELRTIVLAHVIQPNKDLVYGDIHLKPEPLEWGAIKEREKIAIQLQKKHLEDNGYDVSIIDIDGIRIRNLINVIKAGDFDLIVMSTKGRSWLEDKITGSPWSELFNHTKVPIFIIPAFEQLQKEVA